MLSQNYTYYLYKIATAGLASLPGLLSIAFLIAAIAVLWKLSPSSNARLALFWAALIISVVLFVTAFRGATYRFDEQPETLVIESLPTGEPNCGTAWASYIRSGFGMGNPCKKGCYRGRVINKEMRMRGFPPWPEYRREMECWVREKDDLPGFLD